MSPRSVRRLATAAVAIAAAAGCGGAEANGTLGPHEPVIVTVNGGSGGGSAGGASSAAASALVGQWFRLVYATDTGGVRTSETTWEFRSDSSATRSVVARQLSSGFSSVVTTPASWSVSGTTLSITLLPAGGGTTGGGGATNAGGLPPVTGNPPFGTPTDTTRTALTFTFRIDSTSTATRTLFLNELPFVFVGPPATR